MIIFNYCQTDNKYFNYIEVSGHAEYDEIGSDIVCASVSSLTTYAFNLAYTFNKSIVDIKEEENYLAISVSQYDSSVEVVLKELFNLICQLETQYDEYIRLIYKEV